MLHRCKTKTFGKREEDELRRKVRRQDKTRQDKRRGDKMGDRD
jgi:hypothetical protein